MYASPQMGQMPRMSLNFDFNLLGTQRIFPAPQAYMQAPPPGQYPPPPNGAGPRPSMPPTPIPAHAHPYYHQSPQRTSHNLPFCITDQTVHSICHSFASCPVSNDDAPAWWAWWPTARLRWRSCTTRAHGWCRPCMMREIVCHCCLFVFFSAFCSEDMRSAYSSGLHGYYVRRSRRLVWRGIALYCCPLSCIVSTLSVHSFDAPTTRKCIAKGNNKKKRTDT
jgi:hypothetical protein